MNQLQTTAISTFTFSSDGGLIERIGGAQLVRHLNARIEIAVEFAVGDTLYRAAELAQSLETALKLPSQVADVDDPELFATLKSTFSVASSMSEGDAVILAAGVLATWMGGLGKGMCVNLVGPPAVTAPITTLLSSLVRNPLSLATFHLKEMASLPPGLWPVVLLSDPSPRALRDLALATASQPLHVVRRGNLELVPRCSAIVRSDEPASLPAIRINLTGNGMLPPPVADLQALEERLRPRLLRYRLTHLVARANSTSECAGFTPEVGAWARILGAAVTPFTGAPAEVEEALRLKDRERRASLGDSIAATIVEAVFLAIHTSPAPPFVENITRLTNLLLAGRGERELASRAVGARLRKLGIYSERTAAGYRLAISHLDRQRVHRLATQMGVPLPLKNPAGCSFCAEFSPQYADSNRASSSIDVSKVHDVHDVHPTPAMGSAEWSAPASSTGEEHQ